MPIVDRAARMEGANLAGEKLFKALADDLDESGIRPWGPDVMIAVYSRAGETTRGGIIIPETDREDEYQGIVGLILGMGPLASSDNPDFVRWFGDHPPRVGDWVGFDQRQGARAKLGGQLIRLIEWKYLRFPTKVPDLTV